MDPAADWVELRHHVAAGAVNQDLVERLCSEVPGDLSEGEGSSSG